IRHEEEVRRAKEQEEAERQRERERTRVLGAAIAVLSVIVVVIAGLLALTVWQTVKAKRAIAALDQKNKEIVKKNNELEAEKHLRSGTALSRKLKLDDAIREYEEAIAIDPSIPESYSYKGYALIRQKKYPEAIKTLQDLTSRTPDYVWGHYNLALAYWKSKKPDAAFQECQKVLDLDNSFCETFQEDSAYDWVKNSPEITKRCNYESNKPPPVPAIATDPGE
ncbi:MAG TPA: tetratricopeptide repeat protein, partial [Pyrinomonadaceae bacterium]|nr:tetratricopeptide repeat protein [Pyrinomonadaceae bacterium]